MRERERFLESLILVPATFNSLFCQKGQFSLQPYPGRWVISKIFGYYPQKVNQKFFIENLAFPIRRFERNFLFKRQAGQVMAGIKREKERENERQTDILIFTSFLLLSESFRNFMPGMWFLF